MSFSIVIPSAISDNLVICVKAILENDSNVSPNQIIVIDDGAKEGAYRRLPIGIQWVTGIKPFIYSRNCNLGIQEAKGDVILLNDDAILKTKDGLSNLANVAKYYGIVSAVTNAAGNPKQRPQRGSGIRPESTVLAFVCVCIPKVALDTVGLLDERFTAYGWEDYDYCRRAIESGIQLGIYDGCFVDHMSLISTFRGRAGKGGDIEPGRKIFNEKWGC